MKCLKVEKGQTTVLIIALLPIFILLMGWSIDVGRILSAKTELSKATDIAAREIAKEIDLKKATLSGEQFRSEATVNEGVRDWIEKNLQGLNGGILGNIKVEQDSRYIYIESQARLPLFFSGLFGRTSTIIKAQGIGRLRRIK